MPQHTGSAPCGFFSSLSPLVPQELVRLFDTLLGNVNEMSEGAAEAARSPGPAAEEAAKLSRECSAEEGILRAERCALLARAQLYEGRFAEAASLFGRAAELAQRSGASLGAKGKGKGAGAGAEEQRLLALAEAVGTAARKERCSAIVKGVSAQASGRKVRELSRHRSTWLLHFP